MQIYRQLPCLAVATLSLTAASLSPAFAHGIVGARVFPVTLAIDDPAVSDELSLPTVTHTQEDDGSRETAVSVEFAKRLTDRFGISFEEEWSHIKPDGSGFQNLETTFKYLLFTDAPSEFMLSTGASIEWGGTGADRVGAEDFSVVTPQLYFGKGFGDLPDTLGELRPFAITGQFGLDVPTKSKSRTALGGGGFDVEANPKVFDWGFSLQYSLPYMNANVRQIDGPEFLRHLTPVVEFAFSTPVSNTGGDNTTTGTINPGLIYSADSWQLAAEAIIPINQESGEHVGGIVQLHFFLDDIFPNSLGKPLF
ncbi:MAG: hypothetical protein WBP94_02755 [Rhodomicrobiaceae bacterium]